MRSVQLVAHQTLELKEMPAPPDPGPGEVLVRLRAVGICGSDMHWYAEGGIGPVRAAYPQILGHEPAGEIVALGRSVENLRVGQKVSIEPSVTCGHCEFCLSGHHNNCVSSIFMGSPQMPGLFRDYAVVPAKNVVSVPDRLNWVEATVIEPLAVILHVLELVEVRLGDTVAVLGVGPIGMLTMLVARIAGASKIFVADKVPERLRLALELGADCAVNVNEASFFESVMDQTKGRGVDLVFDCAAAVETINWSLAVARLGGRVVMIGIPSEPVLRVDLMTAMAKELSVQTIKRSNHNSHAAIELIESGRITDRIVTHRYPLERTPEAFQTLHAYADGICKAVIEL